MRQGSAYGCTRVDYVVNPPLVKAFNKKREEMAARRGLEYAKPILAFHGTPAHNIPLILKTGFLLSKVGSTTDAGYYGRGIYFSEFSSFSMGYSRGSNRLLICKLLQGKPYRMTKIRNGCKLTAGYDNHTSPDGHSELVMFDMGCILPCYVLHFSPLSAPPSSAPKLFSALTPFFGGMFGAATVPGPPSIVPAYDEEEEDDEFDEEEDEDKED